MDEIYHPRDTDARMTAPARRAPLWHRAIAAVLKAVLPLAILAGAAYLARDTLSGAPVAERLDPERTPRPVAVTTAQAARGGPAIEAWGSVEPARRLGLRAEVSGRAEWVSPALTPGGLVAGGQTLIRLDDTSFAARLRQAEARIAEIEARIRIERGQAQRARRDLERSPLSGLTEEERALILRKPQMAELQAQLAAAEADRDAAAEDRARTRITAPFDAQVQSEDVETGSVLTVGTEVASLVGTAAYRVALAVPQTALDWIDTDAGQRVRLTQPGVWPEGASREGRILRLKPGLTGTGRMAEIIVEVTDPLARGPDRADEPRLLIGSYLRAAIPGKPVPGAVRLDRDLLHDGDVVRVMTPDGTLDLRQVTVAWRGADSVLISEGLDAGERVVTTRLATVAQDMALRLRDGAGE